MTPIEVVHAWLVAVNALDIPGVMAWSTGDVEVTGPRGTSRGQPALREWVERARLHLETQRSFASGDRIVLWQRATWRDPHGLVVAETDVANRFVVSGDRISTIVRYDVLEPALEDARLTASDEIGV